MSFRRRIKYFLVHHLGHTNKDANKIISSGALSINGKIIVQNELLGDEEEVRLNGNVIKSLPAYKYYALYKPVGIESTFDKGRADNLSKVFPFGETYFVAGRLDKASEGLLIISDNGKWVYEVTRPESKKEKEYEVEVDKEIEEEFLEKMKAGVDIGSYITLPSRVKRLSSTRFSIVLTEGKNRQIRRMCGKMGYKVRRLKRVRIDKFYLNGLQPLDYKLIEINI